MTAERWRQIESLFVQVLECPSSERELFLERVCLGDESLRRELKSLLACDTPDQLLVEIPAALGASPSGKPDSEPDMAGRRVGPYRLTRLIGHGGMGSVYLGVRDDDQYQKQVAVKLLKRGMDTDFMLSRFRQERQILANLEHPFIARLLDGGATEDGLPYLVMEYVAGVPITSYCAKKELSVAERLRLFRLVCEAVQYAHQNLVVHRDIKPSNILTTQEGIPKLLDFGIAKVLDPGLPAGVTLTRRELRMLTPEYASPEQAKGMQISTASDIYSLGAVLYEMLAGQGPHQFPSGSLLDIEKTICETELEKPSIVAARKDDVSPGVRKQLRRQLSGDLDNIVLTAMRKEPERRYASAAEFSEDLRRHMEALPILAREDRWTYRAGKFIRRNRLAVGAALLVSASLIGGIVATAMQARRAERRFDLARQLAKAVVANVKGPMEQVPGSTAARAAMIQTVLRYLDGLAQDPGSDPKFQLEIAYAYWEVAGVEANPYQQNLGQTAASLSHYQKAIAIYSRLTARPETRVAALGGLVGASIGAGDVEARNGNAAAANVRLHRVAALAAEAAARDSAAVGPGTWAWLYSRLSDVEVRKGAFEQAVGYCRKYVEVCRKWANDDQGWNAHSTLRGAYTKLGGALLITGDLYGARENHEMALRTVTENLGRPDATVYERTMLSAAHQNLGDLLGNPADLSLGDRSAAVFHSRLAVEIAESIAAADRRDVRARDDVATAYLSLGAILLEEQPAEALQAYQKSASISEELTAAEPSNTKYRQDLAFGQMGVGESLHALGKHREALQKLAPTLEMMKSLANGSTDEIRVPGGVSRLHRDIGNVLLATGDKTGALESYRRALAASEELIRRAPASLYFQRYHADSLESLGRYYRMLARRRRELKGEARAWLQKSLDIWQDWTRRNIAAPYAGVRERQVAALIASIDNM